VNRVFVDTSAILALLVPSDSSHERAAGVFERLRAHESALITTSYVLVETYALLGRRFGRDSVSRFRTGFAPLLDVTWVDRELHERGLDLMFDRPSGVSLVDAVSFVCIRDQSIDDVFAFDSHFDSEGFPVVG
jgi:predicted nucleic acid-binding protein